MANNNQITTSTLIVNGEQAKQELTALQQKAKQLKEQLKAANNAGDVKAFNKYSRELKATNRQISQMEREAFDLTKVLKNLSGTSLKDLLKAQRKLNSELKSGHIKRNTKEWKENIKAQQRVKAEINAIYSEMQIGENRMSRMANGFNKYFAGIATGIAAFTGLSFKFRQLSEDAAKLDDIYSDVMKTTGLTHAQVVDLNEDLKRIDTRTSREELNELAATAGKLGIQGKKNILGFVEAANQIHTALGEDLGEDAIKSIGKMAGVYDKSTREIENLDLKGKMLAIGSAINDVGQSSTASESYLEQFAGRLGGVATQANISIGSILGYASALDQDMQQVEMASTAFQQLIMKVLGEPAKFAKIAGMEVKAFSDLLQKDANQAIKVVLKSLNEKGGFQELIPYFDEMGLSGARAVGVLSAMASSIHKIDEAQAVANNALREGISVTKEYETKNNNAMAELEKAKKEFRDLSLELGEKLNPILLKSTNATSYFIKLLVKYPGVLKTLISLLGVLAVAYAAVYANRLKNNIVSKAAIVLQKAEAISTTALSLAQALLAGNISKATAMWKALNLTMKANVITAILSAVVALGLAIYKMATKTTEAEKALKEMNRELATEKVKLNNLFEAYKKANEGTEEKTKLLNIIKEQYGEYIQDLIDEHGQITNIAEAQERANKALTDSFILKKKNEVTDKANAEFIEKQINLNGELRDKLKDQLDPSQLNNLLSEVNSTINNSGKNLGKAMYTVDKMFEENGIKLTFSMKRTISRMWDALRENKRAVQEINETFNPLFSKNQGNTITIYEPTNGRPRGTTTGSTTTGSTTTGSTSANTQTPIWEKELKKTSEAYKNLENQALTSLVNREATQQEFNRTMIFLELQLAEEKYKILKKHNQNTVEAENEVLNKRLKLAEELEKNAGQKIKSNFKENNAKKQKESEKQVNKLTDHDTLSTQLNAYIQMLNKKKQADQEYYDWKREQKMNEIASYAEIADVALQTLHNIEDAELTSVETKYAKEIQAARKLGQDTTKLEEKKEAEKKEIKKKYADIDFALTAAKIIAETALAVMKAAPKPLLMIAAGVVGASQLALANEQRNAIKNLWTGGYTEDGGKYEPKGIVHAGEFVANQEAVKNPSVNRILKLIDHAQKNNTIGTIDDKTVSRWIAGSKGFAQGGYTGLQEELQTIMPKYVDNTALILSALETSEKTNKALLKQIEKGIKAETYITGKGGSKEANDLYNKMISNARR